jgi:hypothetical protein
VAGVCLAGSLLVSSMPAAGQTRLSLDAGAIFPTGDLADVNAVSPWVGARWEYQDVNALGQISTRTWFLRLGYGIMREDLPEPPADNSDGHYFDACIGGRAYAQSKFSPFFVSVSGGYAQYQFPGPSDTYHGATFNGGLGVRFGVLGFVLEGEARGHVVFLDGTDNFQFFTGIVSLGIPL